MKKAVIVVGAHHVGKSDTIRNYLKPLLKRPDGRKLSPAAHIFELNGKLGHILSQSFEEGKRDVDDTVKAQRHYHYLVFACRPVNEEGSEAYAVQLALRSAGFAVSLVVIMDKHDDRAKKAREIFRILNSQ